MKPGATVRSLLPMLGVLFLTPALPAAAQGGVDLAPVRIVAPVSAIVGDTVEVSVVTRNAGTLAVGTAWIMRVLVSTDNVITTADTVVLSTTINRVIRGGMRDSAVLRVPIPAGTPRGNYFVGALVDAGNAVREENETNNVAASTVATTVSSQWDLTVGTIAVPDSIQENTTLSFRVPIRNAGRGTIPRGWVGRVYLSRDGTFSSDDPYLGDFTFEQSLGPASSAYVPLSYAVKPYGNFRVIVIVDGNNSLSETTEGNNIVPSAATMHVWPLFVDLDGDLLDVPASAYSGTSSNTGETFPVTVVVRNLGTMTAPSGYEVRLFLSPNNNIWGSMENPEDQQLKVYTEMRSIPPRGSITTTVSVSLPAGLTRTDWYLGLKVDPTNTVKESGPADVLSDAASWRGGGNNESAVRFAVTDLPNLQVVSVSPSGGFNPGITGNLSVTYRNAGPGAAASGWRGTVCLEHVSGDWMPPSVAPLPNPCTHGGAGAVSAEFTAANRLDAGASGTAAVTMNLPPTLFPGTYQTRAVVDASQNVVEKLETDNTATRAIEIVSTFDLYPKSIVWEGLPSGLGFATIRVGVTNGGVGTVPEGWMIDVFLSPTPNDQASWRGPISAMMTRAVVGNPSVQTTLDVPLNGVRAGDYVIVVLDNNAKAPGRIRETNDGNNTMISATPIVPPSW